MRFAGVWLAGAAARAALAAAEPVARRLAVWLAMRLAARLATRAAVVAVEGFAWLERRSCLGRRIGFVLGRPVADAQLFAADADLLQVRHQLRRHALRQVDQAVAAADVDAPDIARVQLDLVGDGADQVARLDLVLMAHLDAKGFHVGVSG